MFNFFYSELLDFIECEEEYQPGTLKPTEDNMEDLLRSTEEHEAINLSEGQRPNHLRVVQ